MQNLVVLQENKEGYEPQDQEIVAYGEYLGLSFPADDKFKIILKQALISPLPPGWQACQTTDQHQTLVYRNIKTQQIQEAHPLDAYYMQKINQLKSLTKNLPIQTILEERDSWLKESSDIFGPSRASGDFELQEQKFINQIEEEKSIIDEEEVSKAEQMKSGRSLKRQSAIRYVKTPRLYNRKKQQIKIEDVKDRLMNFHYIPTFERSQIERNECPQFTSPEQIIKMEQVQQIAKRLETKRLKVEELQRQRKRKLEHLSHLKNQLKMQNLR